MWMPPDRPALSAYPIVNRRRSHQGSGLPASRSSGLPPLPRYCFWLLRHLLIISRFYRGHSSQTGAYVTRPFTTDPGSQIQASFSPDGKSVAYVWRKDGKSYGQIYIRSLNSEQPTQLSPEQPANQLNPVWSPDGQTDRIRAQGRYPQQHCRRSVLGRRRR